MVVTDVLFVAFLLGGTVYLLYRSWSEVADKGFAHEISAVTGTVMHEQQRSEARLHGTVGPGQVQGHISTQITRFQEIFLALPDGREARLDFEDFKIPCRVQHVLSVVGVRRNDGAWCDCAYHNHHTAETVLRRDELFETLKYDAAARIGARWGLFLAAVGLFTQWDAGALVEGEILVNVVASGIFGLLAGSGIFAVLWFPVRVRTRSRCAAAERDIEAAIERVDNELRGQDD